MNRSQLRALRNRPFFDVDAIETCLTMGSAYEERHFENDLYADILGAALGSIVIRISLNKRKKNQ